MSSEHPIDDLFRKELESREPEFREEYWNEAERVLEQHPPTILKNSWWKWFGSIMAVAFVAGTIGYFFGMNHSSQSIPAEQQVISTNETSSSFSNNSSGKNQNEIANADSGISGIRISDTAASQVNQNDFSSDPAASNQNDFDKNISHTSASSKIVSSKNSKVNNETTNNASSFSNTKINAQKKNSYDAQPSNDFKKAENNSSSDLNSNSASESQSFSNSSSQSKESIGSNSSIKQNSSQQQAVATESGMTSLPNEISYLSFDASHPSKIDFSPSIALMKKKNYSPLQTLELSLNGAPTLITVPSNKSNAWGYEWNAFLQYRVNNFVTGAGVGQFFVKDHISFSHDSITSNTTTTPFITHDSLLIVDSVLVQDSNFVHWVYDTSLQVIADTTLIQVTTHDTVSVKNNYTSSGHYLELPIMFSYRFYGLGLRWQISTGASYAWYSGGLRYAVNPEGQLISYKPPPVVSILTRLYAQYPLTRKLYLQGYLGARYVIGLKRDIPTNNYLVYSLGAGILYQF